MQEEETLTVNKQRVLEAANKCNQAKEILKTIFPDIFEEPKVIFKLGDILDNGGHMFLVVKKDYGKFGGVHLNGFSNIVYVHCNSYSSLEELSEAWKHMKVIGNINQFLTQLSVSH